jgi:protoheme IX farnesyltransferase
MLPLFFGLGSIYFVGAAGGGFLFIQKAWRLVKKTNRQTAMACFHASLAQLTLVLTAAIIDARF